MTSSFARVVLVTAGAGGLGKGIVRTLASDGYRVAFTYRPTGTSPQTTLEALGVHGDQTLVIPADFTERGAGQHVVNTVESQLGRLDVLVHTVGPMLYR
ncbi:MAG: SDR family NAD(P)-dependent oxidoreductase, partial [Candidatus Eremiobacteraeota bacterium]|nr:SDR family NAD(P)-dependent oxidoreductase [Candidatus Eremiobacteraeota bacterium]